jgi:hypothetical protein
LTFLPTKLLAVAATARQFYSLPPASYAGYLLGLLFDLEDGADKFPNNGLSPKYTAL